MANEPPPPAIEDDQLFTPADEQALDAAFEAAGREEPPAAPALPAAIPRSPDHERTLAEIRAALMPRRKRNEANTMDPAALNRSRTAFDERQRSMSRSLPTGRLRRGARLAALVTLLAILATGFLARTDLVRWFPELAGLYAAIGMPVNVVGLEFGDAKTVMSFRNGRSVMLISSRIRSIAARPVKVPPVLVSLLDANGASVYEWTVMPQAAEMEPGDVLEFSTEVSMPPQGAVSVRLSFTNPRGTSAVPAGII